MSKLRDRIRDAFRRGGSPLGFSSMARDAAARRHVLVMAAVSDEQAARRAVEAGADALLFEGPVSGLGPIVQTAGGRRPVGCRVPAATAQDATALADAGADFFVFDDTRTDAAALLDRRLGHVLQLAGAHPSDDDLRLLQPLDLDAILIPDGLGSPGDGAASMTVREQLQTRRLAQLSGKPLIAAADASATAAALEIWRNAGAPVLLVTDLAVLPAVIEAAAAVPAPRVSGEDRPQPLLPRVPIADLDE